MDSGLRAGFAAALRSILRVKVIFRRTCRRKIRLDKATDFRIFSLTFCPNKGIIKETI